MREIKNWRDDSRSIAEAVQSRHAYLKIVLKTKNELFFLRRWLQYYLSFLPPEAIVILDNMSKDTELLEYYNAVPEGVVIARYDGFHNLVHVVESFPLLYKSLANSSTYFCLFDTDEFLIHIDPTLTANSTTIVPFLRAWEPAAAFPCSWLTNIDRSENIFRCGPHQPFLDAGLKWGKPIVKSGHDHKGIIHHNAQLNTELLSPDAPPELFLLHMKNLNPRQRVRANMEKLISRNIISEDTSVDAAIALEPSAIKHPAIQTYVNELKMLTGDTQVDPPAFAPGMVKIEDGLPLVFHGEPERAAFQTFLRPGRGGAVETGLMQPLGS